MKKILALVLAVAMLSTVAFAATWTDDADANKYVKPDGTWKALGVSAFQNTRKVNDVEGTYTVEADLTASNGKIRGYEFNSDNFAVTVKYKKGADLVKSVAFDNDTNEVKIKMKTNWTLVAPDDAKAANLIIDSLKVKSKRTIKEGSTTLIPSGRTYECPSMEGVEAFVGFNGTKTPVDPDNDFSVTNGKFYSWDEDSNGKQVGTTTLSDGEMTVTGKVYAGDKTYFEIDETYTDDVKAIAKANEDADISCYDVTLEGLSASHSITLNAEKDMKVYKVVDGKLVASGLNWNEDEYAFTGKARSSTTYVVSDIELKGVTTGGSETTNPDTGANDVVGIAAALAVVSLVAAGAVSLKK